MSLETKRKPTGNVLIEEILQKFKLDIDKAKTLEEKMKIIEEVIKNLIGFLAMRTNTFE